MYKSSDFKKKTYKTGEVAKILDVTPRTVMNYDNEGKLKFKRTETNRRIIFREELLRYLDSENLLFVDDKSSKRDIIYARVSSNDQKTKGDLDRQVLYLLENVDDLQNPIVLKDVGSGLNDKRVQFKKLIEKVMNNEVNRIYVTYKDRLTRFGFNSLEYMFSFKDVAIVVLKDKGSEKSVQEEMVEDMMSLITSFSGKLYGLRSRKNTSKQKRG